MSSEGSRFWDDWHAGSLSGRALVIDVCGKQVKETRLGRRRWWAAMLSQGRPQLTCQAVINLQWSFRVVLNWGKDIASLQPHVDQSLDAWCPRRVSDLDNWALSGRGNLERRLPVGLSVSSFLSYWGTTFSNSQESSGRHTIMNAY